MLSVSEAIANISLDNELNEDDLVARHKKERKELQARIQALKKTAGKGDKKKKKEVSETIIQLEFELENKHREELEICRRKKIGTIATNEDSINASAPPPTPPSPPPPPPRNNESDGEIEQSQQQRITKAQKRRDKKLQLNRERDSEIEAQEKLNATGPRIMEMKTINSLLKVRMLKLYPIQSDGDCLYNAIIHQLHQINRTNYNLQLLRNLTADYIYTNKDNLIVFMTNPVTDEPLTDVEFEKYCLTTRTTPAWGGQIEIIALTHILKCPIEVVQANGPPTVHGLDEYNGPNLILTYHRFMYSLGEHYNSTEQMTTTQTDSGDENDETNMLDK